MKLVFAFPACATLEVDSTSEFMHGLQWIHERVAMSSRHHERIWTTYDLVSV